jgi:hypothetical protein
MNNARTLGLLATLLGASLPGLAVAADALPPEAEARSALNRARAGDAGAAETAAKLFHQLSAQAPSNPLFMAYEGSALTLRSRAASSPLDKLDLVEKGLDLLDRSLQVLTPSNGKDPGATPAGLETRLIAGSTFIALPESFHRFEDGKAAINAAFSSPAFSHAPPPLRAQLELQRAQIARTEGRKADEITALRTAVELQPQGPLADRARARLAEVTP